MVSRGHMFERAHHRRIALALTSLDAPLLRDCACLFGGGTAMALRYDEYRESIDMDFLVSDIQGYRHLRQLLTGPEGVMPLITGAHALIEQAREVRADQDGIRTLLNVDGQLIKFEIVLEGRIELARPGADDQIEGVATMSPLGMLTGNLLANADRWADDGFFSRDVIDMAMMRPGLPLLRQALAKAESAYGQAVSADLAKAIERLRTRTGWLERCMQAMQMQVPKAVLWQQIKALTKALPKPPC
jgi:hypothetical protein